MDGHTGMATSLAYFSLNFTQKEGTVAKIWKLSKRGKNARNGKFFCDFIEIAQFDEAAFMVFFNLPISNQSW